jgi:soluble lytic murein transglycosylase-like protein
MITEHEILAGILLTIAVVTIATIIVLRMPGELQASIRPDIVCPLYEDKLNYYISDIRNAVQKYGLSSYTQNPEALVAGLITVESNWREDAVSNVGAIGLMQILPKAHPECDKERLTDPAYNIDCGVAILTEYIASCNGDIEQGLAKYNTGECIGRTKPPDYAQKILAYQSTFGTCLV